MILIGTHYEYPFGGMANRSEWLPKNREDWRRDLEMIRDTGFNSFRIRIGMDSNLDDVAKLLDLAQQFRLRVVFGFATFYVPNWFVEQYPDSKIIDRMGRAFPKDILDFRWPRACINHPEYRRIRNQLIKDCVKRFNDHPMIVAWSAHNKPIIGPGEYPCYCKYTLMKYRKALTGEFKSINKLNLLFHTSFTEFNQVIAPTEPNDNKTFWRHWREFMVDNLTEFLLEGKSIIKKYAPNSRITYNATSPFKIGHLAQDWWTCREFDILGASYYTAGLDEFSVSEGAKINLLKSLDPEKEVWNLECQGGAFVKTMYTGKRLEVELNSNLSRGIRGIFFHRWEPLLSGPTPWMNAMTEVNDYNTERRLRTKKAIADLKPFLHILEKGRNRKPRVGIYLQRDHILDAEERGLPIRRSIEGYYALLSDLGYEVGMILDRFDSSCNYDLVIFPFTYESAEDLPVIQEYIRLGKRVIFELPLSDLEKARAIGKKFGLQILSREAPIFAFSGWDLREVGAKFGRPRDNFVGWAGYERVLFRAPNCLTILTYGDNSAPAVISPAEYEGRILVFGFPLGCTYRTMLHWGVRNFIGGFITQEIQPDVKVRGVPKEYRPLVETHLLETKDKGLLFIMNRSLYEYAVDVEISGYRPLKSRLPIYSATRHLLRKNRE